MTAPDAYSLPRPDVARAFDRAPRYLLFLFREFSLFHDGMTGGSVHRLAQRVGPAFVSRTVHVYAARQITVSGQAVKPVHLVRAVIHGVRERVLLRVHCAGHHRFQPGL